MLTGLENFIWENYILEIGALLFLLISYVMLYFYRNAKSWSDLKVVIGVLTGLFLIFMVGPKELIKRNVSDKVCNQIEVPREDCKALGANMLRFTKKETENLDIKFNKKKELLLKLPKGQAYLSENKEKLKNIYEEM